jgi:hypothetical protein
MKRNINTLIMPGDSSGCSFYRMQTPYYGVRSLTKNHTFIESRKLIGDSNFYKDLDHIRVQKLCNDGAFDFFFKFLLPLSDRYGITITYDIDDVMIYEDMPIYNAGRIGYESESYYNNMSAIMRSCHFVTVTTEELKKYYVDRLDLNPAQVLVMPNYIPRWWSDTYNTHDIRNKYQEKRKKRILIAGSTSHFSLDGKHDDDYTHICDFVRDNVDKYQFVFIPHIPYQLTDLLIQDKIELRQGSDILNYNREVYGMSNVDAILAPLQDNIFNRCKSYIKIKEAFCAGIPIFAQNLPMYADRVDPYHTFDKADELGEKLDKLFETEDGYMDIVTNCRNIADYGDDMNHNGFWLEKHINMWQKLYTMPKSTVNIDLRGV